MSYLSGIGLLACHADIPVGMSRGEAAQEQYQGEMK
jgi:hypothetical protein